MNPKALDIGALFAVPSVISFDLSQRLGRIVFSSNKSGQWQIYSGRLSSGSLTHETQITSDSESKVGARFSPDSEYLMYASDYYGDEKFDLFLTDLHDITKNRNLTENTNYSILPNASFSHDGEKLVYVANPEGQFSVYVQSLADGSIKRISNHAYSDYHGVFSPDDSKVAFASTVSGQDSGLFIVPSDGGETKQLLDQHTRQLIDGSDPEWSPDGKTIAFMSSSRGSYDIGLWEIEEDKVTWLTDSKNEYYEPAFSHDGKTIAYTLNAGGNIKLVLHDMSDGPRVVEFRPGVIGRPKFTHDDESVIFLFTSPKNPPDLFEYNIGRRQFIQLTNSLSESIDASNFVEGRQVYYECKKDGMKVPALLYTPRGMEGRKHLRAVIDIHGGPTAQSLNAWDPMNQVLISKGIVVLSPNYRGSTGFGRAFREANRFVMGDLDLADCASGWDYLVREGIADEKEVAITGASFGGYLTMCALTKYPERWVCGSALVPFLNWFTEIEHERDDLRYWDLQNMGDPSKDKVRLRDASPIFFIDRIQAPVQIIAGAHDPRCPLEESEQARDSLLNLGKQVDFKFYEDEGHGFRKTSNKIDAYKRSLAFLEKYLA